MVHRDGLQHRAHEHRARRLDIHGKPRFVVVNKIDKEHANFDKGLQQMQQRLSAKIVPLLLPIGSGPSFRGVVSVVDEKAFLFDKDNVREAPVPDAVADAVAVAREALMNAAAETSDALVEKFLETGSLGDDEFRTGLGRGIAMGTLYPALPLNGSVLRGVATFLDVLGRFAPSPLDVDACVGTGADGKPTTRHADAAQPLAALAFGSISEANVGDYVYIRVWSGKLSPGMDVLNGSTGEAERVGTLFLLNGKQRVDTEDLSAGEIGAAVKLRNTHVGQTLCDRTQRIALPFPEVPQPLTFVSIKSRTKGDEDKLASGLQRLHEIVANAGCANAATGAAGLTDAREMAALTARAAGCPVEEVVVASTGVIGVQLPMEKVRAGIATAFPRLSREGGPDAARAIMTTDTKLKQAVVPFTIGGVTALVGGMAKGAGMIAPNMATMLAFFTTDAAVEPKLLRRILAEAVGESLNRITVDGDTSTNDCAVVLASGACRAPTIERDGKDASAFQGALTEAARQLAHMLVRDGEGVTRIAEVRDEGERTAAEADRIARTVGESYVL